MSRNLLVFFLVVAAVCATVMSHPPPKKDYDDDVIIPKPPPTRQPHPTTKYPTKKPPTMKPATTKKPLPQQCCENEIWKECGTACQPSCKNPKPVCNKLCVRGCMCKDGLLRNSKGKCVEPCDCD